MKRKKKGFSIDLYTKSNVESYSVYFEEKGKLTFCYIDDSYTRKIFKGKSVKHDQDIANTVDGRKFAFDRAMERRDAFYNRLLKRVTENIISAQLHNIRIEHKAYKLINTN